MVISQKPIHEADLNVESVKQCLEDREVANGITTKVFEFVSLAREFIEITVPRELCY
jgi:hypothetical protein